MAMMKKPAPKKPVALRTPSTGVKKPMPKVTVKPKPQVIAERAAAAKKKPAPIKPKPKPKVVQMPSKISPFKMTPAQKAEYLKNPDRYNG